MKSAEEQQKRWANGLAVFMVVLFCAVAVRTTQAQSSEVRISPASERLDLSPSTLLLEDPEGKLTLTDVQSPLLASRFRPGSPRIGISTSAYWLRYRIRNESPQTLARWFDSGSRRLQEIDLFVPDERGIYHGKSASSTRPFADRPLPTAFFVFPIVLPPSISSDIYLRVRTTGFSNLEAAPQIWQPDTYQKKANAEKIQWLLYLGMAGALGLFNLLLYFSIRDRNYLLYVASLVSVVWAVSSTRGGFGAAYEYLWPNSPVFEQAAWIASVIPSYFFTLLFIRSFTRLRENIRWLDSYLNVCLLIVCVLNGSLVVLTVMQEPSLASTMQGLLSLSSLAALALIAGGLYGISSLAWSGNRSARFLAVAWTPFLLSAVYSALATTFGRAGTPSLLVWASAFELVLMSLALADRFNQERKAKVQAQEERAKAQSALVEGLQQSERELEGKVAQRTAEVRLQAAEIAEWNSKLEERVRDQVGQIDRLGRLRRFFSPQLAEVIVAGGEEALKTHRREISVVFIDLRGFTAFADHAEPEEVIEMLRAFHGTIGRIVLSHEGTLERFAGDSVMVFFNDPVPMEGHAEQAIRMALAMQEAFQELSAEWSKRGFALGLGCGIAKGYATLGEIGFEGRWDYAAIGSVTNLAARLCAEAAPGQILVDQRMMSKIEPFVEAALVGPLALKGFTQPTAAFVVTSLRLSD